MGIKISKEFFRLRILLIFSIFPYAAVAQLPEDYKPSFLVSDHASVHINSSVGEHLVLSATVSEGSYCCKNYFTDQDMHNFRIKIAFLNNSTRVYFVRMDKFGTVTPRAYKRWNYTANLLINSDQKTFRLDPGESKVFYAVTDMSSNNYYPTTLSLHKESLEEDPNAFKPLSVYFPFSLKYLTEKKVNEIVRQEKAKALQSEKEESADYLISSIEEDFEAEFSHSPTEENNKLEEILSEEAEVVLPLGPNTKNEDLNFENHTTYYKSLCTTLKNKANILIEQLQTLTVPSSYNNYSTEKFQQMFSKIEDFNQSYVKASESDNLDPACNDEIIKMMEKFYNDKMRKVNEHLQNLNTTTRGQNGNLPFLSFPPAMMTPKYEKHITPSNDPNAFQRVELKKPGKRGTIRVDENND